MTRLYKLLVIKFIVYLSMQSTTFQGNRTYHCYYVHSIHVLVAFESFANIFFSLTFGSVNSGTVLNRKTKYQVLPMYSRSFLIQYYTKLYNTRT